MLAAVADELWRVLAEEIGLLRRLTPEQVRTFLTGFLERTRIRGGVCHPLLKVYAEEQGNWYLLTKRIQPLLSPFYRSSPRFPTLFDRFQPAHRLRSRRHRRGDDLVRGLGAARPGAGAGHPGVQRPLPAGAGALAATPILHTYTQGNLHAYGLEPQALLVTAATAVVRCTHCHQQQTVAADAEAQWLGQPCLNFRCQGRFGPAERGDRSYYRRLYEQGHVERIFAQEPRGC